MSDDKQDNVKAAIKAYLDERAKNDNLFALNYAKENKSIDECVRYILGEAHKRGNAVYVSDEEVFGWAVHYYDEDDIKINRLPRNVKASVKLSDEDKKKAYEQAVKEYRQLCVDRMRAADEEKAKRLAERRKAEREKCQTLQPSLFDF